MNNKFIKILVIFLLITTGLSGCVGEKKTTEETAPVIEYFTATPAIIGLGNASVLDWSIEGATSIKINNVNVAINGPYTVFPEQNQTYTLMAINSYGTSNASIMVYVYSSGIPVDDPNTPPNITFKLDDIDNYIQVVNTDPSNLEWKNINITVDHHTVTGADLTKGSPAGIAYGPVSSACPTAWGNIEAGTKLYIDCTGQVNLTLRWIPTNTLLGEYSFN